MGASRIKNDTSLCRIQSGRNLPKPPGFANRNFFPGSEASGQVSGDARPGGLLASEDPLADQGGEVLG